MDSIPIPTSEDYFDSESSSSGEEGETESKVIYIPKCPENLKPKIGQSFITLDQALDFYNNYARHVGEIIICMVILFLLIRPTQQIGTV
ncbi:protein FAR1-RELATED SEQUENCE 5-like [Salvia divinorum]|uniref:Protein FAR1-RELATED SEQUENCE 5-like n=1 Tax=Salvia divinorum TaxID=28513 RepID=A0ABD1FXE9_SALDI